LFRMTLKPKVSGLLSGPIPSRIVLEKLATFRTSNGQ
jgi:hypothetical protein